MTVSILGCGWYGKALAIKLVQNGFIVKGSTTSPNKLEQLQAIGVMPYLVNFNADGRSFDPDFFKCDILVVSIPPGLRSGKGSNFLNNIKDIVKAINQFDLKKVIYISSTGVYGDLNGEVNEWNAPHPDTEGGAILLEVENRFLMDTSFKTTILRFGGLVGPGRHPGRFFAGKANVPNGQAPVNLIHQFDCVGITLAVIQQDIFGYIFNACSPDHPSKAVFYKQMATKANLPQPHFFDELKSWKLVNSINLSKLNYRFIVDNWEAQSVVF